MSLPKSLTQPLRQGQLTVGAGWRAFVAPFNQALAVSQTSTSLGPTIYDLEVFAKLIDSAAPTGWADLGYVTGYKPAPASKVGNVVTGYRGAVRAKYRADVAEKFTLQFEEWTRMAFALSRGTQVFNLLKSNAAASSVGPLSSSGIAAVAMGASGYSATGFVGVTTGPAICVPAGSGSAFAAGSFIVADKDYDGSSFGFVGDAGANVFQGAVSDTDFIRKTSDYVATVKQVIANGLTGQDVLVLTKPFIGGGNAAVGTPNTAPTTGAKVQAVSGFAAREGGTFIREWSCVMVLDTVDASQLLVYYPRVAPDTFPGYAEAKLQNANSLNTYSLQASFEAMAFDDPLDGETVVSYSAYYPHPSVDLQI